MKQVLQGIDSGATEIRDVPAPVCGPGEVLISVRTSLLSAGTERSLVQFTQRSLLGKARERPDQVRRVLEKMKREGVMETLRQVRARMQDPLALGYSSAGVVLEVGREVRGFRPGDRVAGNGPHAEVVAVPQNLVAAVPDSVPFDRACYAVVGAIALQGVRLARVSLGERVAVIGLGLLGQIAVRLLRASGCEVMASDPDPERRFLAEGVGAATAAPADLEDLVMARTGGRGADAVIIAASSDGNGPMEAAAAVARRRARLVAVGAVRMDVPRRVFYPKELELVVSCSYGPGRYDPEYEERGRDYPFDLVRWTEQRNIGAVLGAMAQGGLDPTPLTTHRFPIADAERAYALLEEGAEPSMGIVLDYPGMEVDALASARRVELPAASGPPRQGVGVAVAGAGNFSGAVLVPAIEKVAGVRLRTLASAGGVHASVRGERHGFEVACSGLDPVLEDPAVDAVFLVTRHDLHAEQAAACLRAGKAVYVEKPLAITTDALRAFEDVLAELGPRAPLWTVGFNRRFAAATVAAREFFRGVTGPRAVTVRFNAGPLPAEHWTQDPEVGGGRILGEACHAVDLCIHLIGSLPVRVFAEGIAGPGTGDAEAMITMRFADGSAASIAYLAGGDKGFPKERVEMFGGGRVAVIDDFASVELSSGGKSRKPRLGGRDKGHDASVAAFLGAVRSGSASPIAAAELLAGARASLALVDSLDTGLPVDLDPGRAP